MPAPRALAPALLVLSFVLGAATEVELGAAGAPRLGGTSATAFEQVELVLQDISSRPLVAGTQTEVGVLVAGDSSPAGARARLDAGQASAAAVGVLGVPERSEALRCSAVVAAAARTPGLPDADEEVAVREACSAALAGRRLRREQLLASANVLETPEQLGRRADRALALHDAAAAGPAALRPRVSGLEAAVEPGTTTASTVVVRLVPLPGDAALVGDLVRVAYPGGSVSGRTGTTGEARLAVPDVALDEPLPLRVTWRGSAPAGTFVGPFLEDGVAEVAEAEEPAVPLHGWLRDDLPYGLEVVVTREAA